jgi:hypothetical protein
LAEEGDANAEAAPGEEEYSAPIRQKRRLNKIGEDEDEVMADQGGDNDKQMQE